MAESVLFPHIRRAIFDFIEDQEGNVPRNKILTVGSMMLILGMFILRIRHILPTHRIPLTTTAMLPITTVIPPMLPTAIAILHTAVQPQQGVHQVHLEARLEMQDYCLEEQLLLHMGFIRRVPKRKSKKEDRILLARD